MQIAEQGTGPLVLLLHGRRRRTRGAIRWGRWPTPATTSCRRTSVATAAPIAPAPPLSLLRERFGDGFYQIYFQRPGVAEAELGADPRTTFRKLLGGSAEAPVVREGEGFLDRFAEPATLHRHRPHRRSRARPARRRRRPGRRALGPDGTAGRGNTALLAFFEQL
ncbi:hypothetical protein [Amycolatopsis sp. CA-126428]|uniref:hypothetical protein n=1 Tax=Amycolatopsis sp. CA-126428 TaxID=2073158 RepID=UPI0027154852|nr:hypothetical protein [Amycolatopsis sp. CA-126428]